MSDEVVGSSAVTKMRAIMTRCVAEAWEVSWRGVRLLYEVSVALASRRFLRWRNIDQGLTPHLMAALKDWKTRGTPIENESDDDSATVSDSNESDSGSDEDLFEPLYNNYGPRLTYTWRLLTFDYDWRLLIFDYSRLLIQLGR